MANKEEIYVLKLDGFKRRLLINGLNEYLTLLAEREIPSEDVCELLAEVLALPRRQRETILLYYYHGMTVTEVAEALEISQPSVTRRIKSAKAKLKKLLEEEKP